MIDFPAKDSTLKRFDGLMGARNTRLEGFDGLVGTRNIRTSQSPLYSEWETLI